MEVCSKRLVCGGMIRLLGRSTDYFERLKLVKDGETSDEIRLRFRTGAAVVQDRFDIRYQMDVFHGEEVEP